MSLRPTDPPHKLTSPAQPQPSRRPKSRVIRGSPKMTHRRPATLTRAVPAGPSQKVMTTVDHERYKGAVAAAVAVALSSASSPHGAGLFPASCPSNASRRNTGYRDRVDWRNA
nr:hypothetical protein CFP56_01153 [Quercus suber]